MDDEYFSEDEDVEDKKEPSESASKQRTNNATIHPQISEALQQQHTDDTSNQTPADSAHAAMQTDEQ